MTLKSPSRTSLTSIDRDTFFRIFDTQEGVLHSSERTLYPDPRNATELAVRAFTLLAQSRPGGITLVDGAFDIPHPSHSAYLRHVRAIGAAQYLQREGIRPTVDAIRSALASRTTGLVVTLDADAKVAAKKGGLSAKGGAPRPIYPWVARASQLLELSYTTNGTVQNTVDLVTVEGEPEHAGTPFETWLDLAELMKERGLLETVVVFGEHSATADEADNRGLKPIIIPEGQLYSTNPQTDQEWHSSDIARRVQGTPVANPITRPDWHIL